MTSFKTFPEKSFTFQFSTIFEYINGQRYAKIQNECGHYYSKNKVFINNGDMFNAKYIIEYFKKTQNIEEFIDNNNISTNDSSMRNIGIYSNELIKKIDEIVDEATLIENMNIIGGIEFLKKKQYEEFLDQTSNIKKMNFLKNKTNEYANLSRSHLMSIQHSKRNKNNNYYFKIMTSLFNEQLNETKHLKNCEIIKKQEIPFKLMQCSIIIFDITNYSEYELHQARISFNYIFNELMKYTDEELLKSKENGIIRKFLLISTAMTWVKENNNLQIHNEYEEQETDFGITQESILERLPLTKYQNIFEFEKLILKSNSSRIKDIFKTFIIGTGIIYGQEENALHHIFKSALTNPKEMYIAMFNYKVPVFHIDELVKLVFIISKYDDRVKGHYVLAIEQESYGFNNIIKSLCNEYCGSRLVLKEDHFIMKQYKFNDFTWDLICSDLAIDPMLDIIIPDYQIQRTSIIFNIKESIREFVEANNFHSLKLIVSGQVKDVVTDIAKHLAQYYQLQLINVHGLINNHLTMLKNNQNKLKLNIIDIYEKRTNIINALTNITDQFKDENVEHINAALKIIYSSDEKIIGDSSKTFVIKESSETSLKSKNIELECNDYFQENTNKQCIQSKKELFEVEKNIINIKHLIKNLNDKYEEYVDIIGKNKGQLDTHFLLPLIIETLSSFSCRNQGYVLDIFPLTYEQVNFIFNKVVEHPNFIVLLSSNTNTPTTIEKTCSTIHSTHEYQANNTHVNNKTANRYEITTTKYMRNYFMSKNVKILRFDVPLELTNGKMNDLINNHYINSIITQIGHTPNEADLRKTIINLRQKTLLKTMNKTKAMANIRLKTALNKLNIMKEQWDSDYITTQKSKKKHEHKMSVNIHTFLKINVLPLLMKEICLIDNGEVPVSQFPERTLNKTKLCDTLIHED